jgi:hypothetical protein
MENTSNSGACIRVKKQIDVGAKLRVQWRREEFSGVARYCRKEGIDYLVGIQRDAKKSAVAKKVAAASVPARDGLKNGEWNVSVSPDENNDGMGSGPGETGKRPPEVTTVVTERIPAGEAGEGADFAGGYCRWKIFIARRGLWGRAGATASTKWWKCCTANTFGDCRKK